LSYYGFYSIVPGASLGSSFSLEPFFFEDLPLASESFFPFFSFPFVSFALLFDVFLVDLDVSFSPSS